MQGNVHSFTYSSLIVRNTPYGGNLKCIVNWLASYRNLKLNFAVATCHLCEIKLPVTGKDTWEFQTNVLFFLSVDFN